MSHSIMHKILFRLSAHCRCRVINGNDKQPYLERYHLLSLPFGIHCYLHRFVAGDPGKGLHNHPWKAAASFILSGQYVETRLIQKNNDMPFKKRIVRAGRVNLISGSTYHRIDLAPKQQVWSLFIHSQKQASWGFINHHSKQLAYQDHNVLVQKHDQPNWWQKADKPSSNPLMRQAF